MSGGTVLLVVVLALSAALLLAIFQPWRPRHPEQLDEQDYLALLAGEVPDDENDASP